MLNLFPFLKNGEVKINYTAEVRADNSYGDEDGDDDDDDDNDDNDGCPEGTWLNGCGECWSDFGICSNPEDPEEPDEPTDCNGDIGGSASDINPCQECMGGNTGIYNCPEDPEEPEEPEEPNNPPVENPCAEFGSSASMAACGCIGGSSGRTECPPDPCDQAAQAAGTAATNLFNNVEVQSKLLQTGSVVPGFPESGFSIRQSATDGSISTSAIETGTPNSVNITNYQNSIADVHVHANSNYPPSATDIFSLAEISFFGDPPNLNTSFVVGNDGTQYAITVTDQSKMTAFYNQMNGAVDPVTNNMNPTTALGQIFENSYDYFLNQMNYSPRDAFERATAAILEDSGISLLKAPPISPPATNSDFKKIGVDKSTDSNGNTTFNASDCP